MCYTVYLFCEFMGFRGYVYRWPIQPKLNLLSKRNQLLSVSKNRHVDNYRLQCGVP